jgi:threonine dehydrogenase-like Zn-dependent dehydrogenase
LPPCEAGSETAVKNSGKKREPNVRAVFFERAGAPLKLIAMDVPNPGPGEMVIKVHRCGICGSDVHLTVEPGYYPENSIIGHEHAGEVVAIGRGVEGFKIGNRVTALPAAGCNACLPCLTGQFLLCERGPLPYPGGFADYVKVSASTTVLLPDTLSLADGALVEPLSVGLHGVVMAKLEPGTRVLVTGAGAIALAAIYWARRLGAGKIVAMSRSKQRAEMALKMGADYFVQTGENEVNEVREALGGAPEVVFEGIGVVGALSQCINHVGSNGKVVSLGFCTKSDGILPSISTFKQVTLIFAMAYTLREFQYCADTMDRGDVDAGAMITRTIRLEDVPETITQLRSGGGGDVKIHADMTL